MINTFQSEVEIELTDQYINSKLQLTVILMVTHEIESYHEHNTGHKTELDQF